MGQKVTIKKKNNGQSKGILVKKQPQKGKK